MPIFSPPFEIWGQEFIPHRPQRPQTSPESIFVENSLNPRYQRIARGVGDRSLVDPAKDELSKEDIDRILEQTKKHIDGEPV